MSLKKLYIPLGLLLIAGLWSACVDIPNSGPTIDPTYLQSLVRFANFATDVAGGGQVTVDGAAVGQVGAIGDATGYMVIESGSRTLGFSGSTSPVSFGSEQQGTVFIHLPDANNNRFLFLGEGSKYWNANPDPSMALVRFVNLANTTAQAVTIVHDSIDGPARVSASAYLATANYDTISPGTSTFITTSRTSYAATLAGAQEVPPVNTSAMGSATVTFGAGLSYSVTVPIDSAEGFYSMAHFHNAPAGTNGSVILPIFTSSANQQVGFASADLSGANEPDTTMGSDTTHATGTGTFTLTSAGLEYSIDISPGEPDTLFTMGHFHNAAAGSNGPVVRTLFSTPINSNMTLTGTWTSTDAEPLTPALMVELLAGRIYVNIHSSIHPGGAIRAQLVPNPTMTFDGSWPDTAITQGLLNDLNAGNVYVNFHTVRNPGGQIRGQLMPTDSVLGGISMTSMQFEGGKLYSVVVVGDESNLQLLKMEDRQGPNAAKPAVDVDKKPRASK